jgi:flavin reductase (DIM6/NTAB) family NADH-FMN oxidoreductase RutF
MSGLFADFVARADAAALVVTAFDGRERSGCLVGFASQCSIEPPRLVVWLSTVNHTFGVATKADLVAVHLVAASARAVAKLFAEQSGDWTDKFDGLGTTDGPEGVPLLDDCPDRVVGRVLERLDVGGDHVGFVLEVVDVTLGPRSVTWLHLADVGSLTPGHPVE